MKGGKVRNTNHAALIVVLLLANTSHAIVVERLQNREFTNGTLTTANNWTIPAGMNIQRLDYSTAGNFHVPGTLPAAANPIGLQSVVNNGSFAAVDITQTQTIPAGIYNITASGWARVYDDSAGQSRARFGIAIDGVNQGFMGIDNNAGTITIDPGGAVAGPPGWTPWTLQTNSVTNATVANDIMFTFRVVANGNNGWSQVVGDTFSFTTEANNSIITAPNAAFGRVMQNQTPSINVDLTKTGSDATTYTATPTGAGISVTADGSIGSGSPVIETIGVQLQNDVAGSATTGVKSYDVTIDNTATTGVTSLGEGVFDPNDTVNVSATIVADRTVSASAVNLGNVIKGALTAPAVSSLTTAGDDDNFTRVTVNGTSASDGSVTVAAGSSQLFDAAADTTNRSVSGIFATAGAHSGDVVLSVTGEGLAGEAVNPVSVHYTANAFDASSAAFLANGGTTLAVNMGTFDPGSGVQISTQALYNILQTIGFTAELDFDTILGSGDTGLLFTDLVNGEFTALAAGAPNAYQFDISFDTNNAPGTYNATYELRLSDADAYAGAGGPGSQLLTLNLTGTIVPEPAITALLVLVLGLPALVICRRVLA